MSHKLLEAQVKKQSKLLEKQMPALLNAYKGKYVAFYDGTMIFDSTHKKCFDKAEKQFGPAVGFVIDEITSQVPMISALVKLK